MQTNPATREIVIKVVYCGPGLAGKSTNLQHLHDQAAPGTATDLLTVDSHSERAIRFERIYDELGLVRGHRVRAEFWTIPGQSYYAATRKAVLAGVDGVVFVADSRREAMDENVDAMNELLANLRALGQPEDLPIVLQYNKLDLPTATRREQLEPLLNIRGWPSFTATAIRGEGVTETARAVLDRIIGRLGGQASEAAPEPQPMPAQVTGPRTWLISCWRCQTMLEVSEAKPGATYTCGACASIVEVVDSERGLTRQPGPKSGQNPVIPGPKSGPNPITMREDSGGYAAQPVREPSGSQAALRPSPVEAAGTVPGSGGTFPIDGFVVVALMEETPLGRRMRVRENAGSRHHRAVVLSRATMGLAGYRDGLEPYIRLGGPVRHPNVLLLNQFFNLPDGAVLLSNDAPEHEPLSHVLARRRALAPPHAMGVIRQIALALEESARHGVVHGWLRPEIVLVSADGNVLVDELCIPKPHRFLVRELAGASAATEYYLAPEHIGEETRSDIRSDIFCLGALLFRMITGEGLVTGYSAHEALHKIAANGARPLRATQAPVSRELDVFYKRLVAIERGERFQSYHELIEALDRFGGGAKRQTMRLTQSVGPNQPGQRLGLGSPAAGAGGGTVATRRTTAGLGARPPSQAVARAGGEPRESRSRSGGGSGSGTIILILVLVLLAGAAAAGYFVFFAPKPRPVVIDAGDTPTTPGATPAKPATAPSVPPGPAPVATAAPTLPAPTTPPVPPTSVAPVLVPANTVTTANPAPVAADPPPVPVPDTPVPVVKVVEPDPAETPQARAMRLRTVRVAITDDAMSGRFASALEMCGELDTELERRQKAEWVAKKHQDARQALEQKAAGMDAAAAKTALDNAVMLWRMPGDREWADKVLKQPRAVAPAPVTPPPAPPAPPVVAPPAPAPPPHPVTATKPVKPPEPVKPDPAKTAPTAPAQPEPAAPPERTMGDVAVDLAKALHQGNAQQIAAVLAPIPADTPEGRAFRRFADLCARRSEMMQRAVAAKQLKLRVNHPITQELCDVTGADGRQVELTGANGNSSSLPWSQISPTSQLGTLFLEATRWRDITPEDRAIAAAALLAVREHAFATLALRPAKGQLAAETFEDLELVVRLQRSVK